MLQTNASVVFQVSRELSFQAEWEQQQSIFHLPAMFSDQHSPAVSQRRLPWRKVPVFQVALHLLQLVWPQALVDARRELVAQWWDDVAVAVKAKLLTHLEAGEEEAKVGDDLSETEGIQVHFSFRVALELCGMTVISAPGQRVLPTGRPGLPWWNLLRQFIFIHLLTWHGCTGKINVRPSWHLQWNMRASHAPCSTCRLCSPCPWRSEPRAKHCFLRPTPRPPLTGSLLPYA